LSSEEAAYAGRWVALVRGKIIAQGESREQVFHAARNIRSKEVAEIRYMPAMPVSNPLLDAIRALVPPDEPIALVGGAVRDAVMGRATHDLDFACRHGLKLAKKVSDGLKAAYFPLDENFDTGRVILLNPDGSRETLDFTGYRGETLMDDLAGRDFTINAVAMDLHSGEIIDPMGGVNDIRARLIRACRPSSLSDDPVRILRAVRQAAAFGFRIQPETRTLMKSAAASLQKTSPERLRDELFKMLAGRKPDASIRALELLGVFPYLLPELSALRGVEQSAPHVQDVWAHTLAVLRHLEHILGTLAAEYDEQKANSDLINSLLVLRLGRYREQISAHLRASLNVDRPARGLLFFAALYHDVDKPQTKTIEESGRIRFLGHDELGAGTAVKRGSALRLSKDELERLSLIIKHHMRVHGQSSRAESGREPSRKAIYRFFRDAGEAGIDLILLALADTRATYEHTLPQEHWAATLETCRTLLEAWFETPEEVIHPRPVVNGDDLLNELKLKPGPDIGSILEAIRENQAAGKISAREEALAFARGWVEKARVTAIKPTAQKTSAPPRFRKEGKNG
jgi:tRNA nucleotidyltransferase/poly(A) polymerase